MPSFGNIAMGLIGVVGGVYMIKEAYFLNHQVYFLAWAENKWGPGAGTLAYRYLGLGFTIFSIFVLIGWINLFDTQSSVTNPTTTPSNQVIFPQSESGNVQIAP